MVLIPEREKALALHKEAIVVDFHCDTLKNVVDWPRIRGTLSTRRKLGEGSDEGHIDLPRLVEGGESIARSSQCSPRGNQDPRTPQ